MNENYPKENPSTFGCSNFKINNCITTGDVIYFSILESTPGEQVQNYKRRSYSYSKNIYTD